VDTYPEWGNIPSMDFDTKGTWHDFKAKFYSNATGARKDQGKNYAGGGSRETNFS